MSSESAVTTLVVNPTAGGGRSLKVLPRVLNEFVRGLPEGSLKVLQASSYDGARAYCQDAVAAAQENPHRGDRLVVMGGDGLLHLGVNACGGTDVPLGMIPAGTGNDICRGVGIPQDSVQAAKIIVDGHTTRIDLASVVGDLRHGTTHKYVGSTINSGYDAYVGARGARMSAIWGRLTYTIAALVELRRFEPLTYRLRIDGVERNLPAMFVVVGNGCACGGGMKLAPNASVTDGLLDVTIVHPVSRFTLLRLLLKTFDGSFAADPSVELLRAKEIVIDGDALLGIADGETLGDPPLGVTCAREAMTVFTQAPTVPALKATE